MILGFFFFIPSQRKQWRTISSIYEGSTALQHYHQYEPPYGACVFVRTHAKECRTGGSCIDGPLVIPIYKRGIQVESKKYVARYDMLRQTPIICNGINRLLEWWIEPYLTVVITLELLSSLTVPSGVMDNYMTTHFVHRWFHIEFSHETGQYAKKFGRNRIFF